MSQQILGSRRSRSDRLEIDPRGQQFAAVLTSAVLVAVLLSAPGPLAGVLLGVQASLFALAAVRGVHRTPVATVFRTVVRPRLSPPAHLEDPGPPRFAQALGLAFTVVALVGFGSGATTLGYLATGAALAAALLNATIGLCLGCELYLLGRRALAFPSPHQRPNQIDATPSATRVRSTT
jgi:hypothetical protein